MRLLGELSVEGHGETIRRFPTQQTAALLAFLAYHRRHPQPREVLLEVLWPEVEPQAGRNRLNVALTALRKRLEPPEVQRGSILITERSQVSLSDAVATDVEAFEAAADQATARPTDPVAALQTAIAKYTGPLLPGFYQPWILPEAARLSDRYHDLLRRLVDHLLAADQGAEALATARLAVAAEPLREAAHAMVIQVAVASGDLDLARQQYAVLEETLRHESGTAPSAAVRALLDRPVTAAVVAPAPVTSRDDAPRPAVGPGTRTLLAIGGRCDGWLAEVAQSHRGQVLQEWTDGAVLEFSAAGDAARCAFALADRGLRLGLHLTDQPRGGLELPRHLAALGHPAQILCTESLATLLQRDHPGLVTVAELERYRVGAGERPERLYQASEQPLPPDRFPPLAAERDAAGQVPWVASRFFGRADAQQAVRELLVSRPGIVTITGPGGSGKTRLATELARSWPETQPVWFVPLASLHETAELFPRILRVMGSANEGVADALARLVWALERERCLLVLDNYEHLPASAVSRLADLWRRVPALQCLVTSRHRLGLEGEQEYALAPLPLAASGTVSAAAAMESPAVAMFVDRARSASPAFGLTDRNAATVAEICRRLEGLPLAIELAAARVQTLPPAALLHTMTDYLDWSSPRRAGLPPRQRSLRATLEWSYELLPAPLQRFLAGLCVFRGPFLAADAAAVAADDTAGERLLQLRGYSLVTRQDDELVVRFNLLETVREFLLQQQPERVLTELRERHARHYLGKALATAPTVAEQLSWAVERDAELDDLREALSWAMAHEPELALRAATALTPLWEFRGHNVEACDWLERALQAAPGVDGGTRARGLLALGRLAAYAWPLDRAQPVLEEGLALLRDSDDYPTHHETIFYLGIVAGSRADLATIDRCHDEAIKLAARLGTPEAELLAVTTRSMTHMYRHQYRSAIAEIAEATELCVRMGNLFLEAVYLTQMALLCCCLDEPDLDEAERLLHRIPLAVLEQAGGWWVQRVQFARGYLRSLQRRWGEAATSYAAMAESIAGSAPTYASEMAEMMAIVISQIGCHAEAVGWIGQALRWQEHWNVRTALRGCRREGEAALQRGREALGEAGFDAALEASRSWTTHDLAVALANLPAQVAAFEAAH